MRPGVAGGQLDKAFAGELERVGGEVEQHAAERHRVTDAEVRLGHGQPYRQVLLLRDRLHDVADRLENIGDGKRNRIQVHQPIAAAGQLDHVAGHRAETESGAVDQTELPFLHRVHRATAAPLEGFRQKENRGERRAQIVSDLHHQLQSVRPGESIGEVLRPVGFEVLANPLDGVEHLQQLAGIGRRQRRRALEKGGAYQAQPFTAERIPGERAGLSRKP